MANRILVATRKGLFIYGSAQDGWRCERTAFVGDSVTYAAGDPRSGNLYAALKHGHFGVKLHRSQDGGASWEEIGCPAYPPFPDGREPDRCPMRGIEIPWALEQIWSLVPGGADQPGRLWCGTIPGGLFKSDDHGASWELVESLWNNPERAKWMGGGYDYPGIHSICVDPRDSRCVRIAVSCGGVWRTSDDGASWELLGKGLRAEYAPPELADDVSSQDAHLMAHCPSQPDNLWIQHHNGIFRSTDGAENWKEFFGVKPSVFGFAVAVHPQDPDTAWFAPAIKDEQRVPVGGRMTVTRTRDGGKTFESFGEGLPQEHAYHLVYRHGLVVDGTGSRLAMGSTTGSLWASDSGGEKWIRLSAELPPVYSVGFI